MVRVISAGAVFVILLLHVSSTVAISCRDDQNAEVDWLIAYKYPRLSSFSEWRIQDGESYAYISSEASEEWTLSSNIVDYTSDTLFSNTLSAIYANASGQVGVAFYNDQQPNGIECDMVKGHSKGLVAIDDSDGTAIWIVHSVPHFPPAEGPYAYPYTGHRYGQHFFCVSLHAADLLSIGDQFQFTNPCYYGVAMTANQLNTYQSLAESVKGGHVQEAPWQRQVSLTTRGGASLIHFGKYANFQADLYSDLVAPSLGSDLRTETWQNDGASVRVRSTCNGPFTVENVLALNFSLGHINIGYNEQNDHSKWAVAVNWQCNNRAVRSKLRYRSRFDRMQVAPKSSCNKYWVCLGDINRETSQFERPGGTLCIYNPSVWARFNESISSIELC